MMGGFPNMIERVCNVMIPNVNKWFLMEWEGLPR